MQSNSKNISKNWSIRLFDRQIGKITSQQFISNSDQLRLSKYQLRTCISIRDRVAIDLQIQTLPLIEVIEVTLTDSLIIALISTGSCIVFNRSLVKFIGLLIA